MKTQEVLVTISHAPHDAEAFFISKDGETQTGHKIEACEFRDGRLLFHGSPVWPTAKPPEAPKPIAPVAPAAIAPKPAPTPAPQPAKPAPAAKPVAPKPATPKANAPAESLDLG